jgi:hypothetical protein
VNSADVELDVEVQQAMILRILAGGKLYVAAATLTSIRSALSVLFYSCVILALPRLLLVIEGLYITCRIRIRSSPRKIIMHIARPVPIMIDKSGSMVSGFDGEVT